MGSPYRDQTDVVVPVAIVIVVVVAVIAIVLAAIVNGQPGARPTPMPNVSSTV